MKVSVVTVCFNSAAHIADTLHSVDKQSWPNIEHLIIDGASKDATLAIVAQFPKSWRTVVSEPDRGIYDAMNKGIRRATGDVVGFINSDDFFSDEHALERVAMAFADPTVEACYGDLCYVREDDPSTIVRYWRSSDFRPGQFRRGWVPPHPTLYVRRAVLERLGSFDLDYPIAADFELMARLLEVHRIRAVHIPEVLVHMRLGGTTNRSLSNIVRQNREIWCALRRHRLKPSLPGFVVGKLVSRGRQFLARPG